MAPYFRALDPTPGNREEEFPPTSAVTRPGFSDETLLGDSFIDVEQEWGGSAYPISGPPVPSSTSEGYGGVGAPYSYPAGEQVHPSHSQPSTTPLSHHSYPIDPVGIGRSMLLNISTPPTIDPRATYSSYPPLPLPPRQQTDRPWTMDISEDGTQFISLRDCELNMSSQGGESGAGSAAWTTLPEGHLNTISGHVVEIRGSELGTGIG